MRTIFHRLVQGLVFPYLFQRMSAKTEGQLDEEWRHIYSGIARGFVLEDFAPTVAGVFAHTGRQVCVVRGCLFGATPAAEAAKHSATTLVRSCRVEILLNFNDDDDSLDHCMRGCVRR